MGCSESITYTLSFVVFSSHKLEVVFSLIVYSHDSVYLCTIFLIDVISSQLQSQKSQIKVVPYSVTASAINAFHLFNNLGKVFISIDNKLVISISFSFSHTFQSLSITSNFTIYFHLSLNVYSHIAFFLSVLLNSISSQFIYHIYFKLLVSK